ncbi:MAG: hypothetical protein ACI8QC_001881 [Planctomycetota bacterium]|jgi:hypothetical protein
MSLLQSITRPAEGEFHPYFGLYIDQVPGGDALACLREQEPRIRELASRFPADREQFRYAEGKWSAREVVGHMIDTEAVFGFRALWFARGAEAGFPGMEQDDWARESNAHERPMADLGADMLRARQSSLGLFEGLDESALLRQGTSDGGPLSVRATAWILAGHYIHHEVVLAEHYLGACRA